MATWRQLLRKISSESTPTSAVAEHEFLTRLRSIERRAILPIKWALLFIAVAFWLLSHPNHWPPPVEVFTLFTVYFMVNVGETYLLLVSGVALRQTRALCILSYFVDVLFVTVLIYFDARRFPAPETSTDFYAFFFVLILRGFALFQTARANLSANALIGAIFIVSLLWQETDVESYPARNDLIRVVFLWLIITMSWFIVEVINRQKEEIARTRERLVQSENMAIVGELAAGVAHEINNPIGIISAYAEFLIKNSPPDDARLEDIRIIHKEARRCEQIVSGLLEYARPAESGIRPINLLDLNDEVLEFIFRRQTPDTPKVELVREYATTAPAVHADPNQLKQALLNIYLNAQQAMPHGGTLRVGILTDPDDQRTSLRISDTGRGISAENLRRIFDPFFTTRARGTGLGLSIARRIVESFGGVILVESIEGHGTTVTIQLPMEPLEV